MNLKLVIAVAAASLAIGIGPATVAQATTVLPAVGTPCASTDIDPNASACRGFYSGNLLNDGGKNHINTAYQIQALSELGFDWDGSTIVEKLEGLNGSHTVDFASLLNGVTFMGVHFGNGVGGPGNATAFYRFDAGVDRDTLALAYNASSNAVLYHTGPHIDVCAGPNPPPICAGTGEGNGVPEPGVWAMMIVGFGGVGAILRRRRLVAA
jgi:hypothetical protein